MKSVPKAASKPGGQCQRQIQHPPTSNKDQETGGKGEQGKGGPEVNLGSGKPHHKNGMQISPTHETSLRGFLLLSSKHTR